MFTKRSLYVSLFTFLGFLCQQLIHGVVEIWYTGLLLHDFSFWGFGLSWHTWILIHHILTAVLLVLGLWLGYSWGKHWWKVLYDDHGTLRKDFLRTWRF